MGSPQAKTQPLRIVIHNRDHGANIVDATVGTAECRKKLKKMSAKPEWGPAQDAAFEELKLALTTAPILRQASPAEPYTLRTNVSSYALGAALLQGEGVEEKPIEYASRLLTPPERNYSTTEREALALV